MSIDELISNLIYAIQGGSMMTISAARAALVAEFARIEAERDALKVAAQNMIDAVSMDLRHGDEEGNFDTLKNLAKAMSAMSAALNPPQEPQP
jgi:hypothetical protein